MRRKILMLLAALMCLAMAAFVAGCSGGGSGEPEQSGETQQQEDMTETTEPENTGAVSSSGEYNMTNGMMTKASDDGSIEYLYFNDFMITMPNNDKWAWEQTADNSISFYYFPAQQEGYGGRLVSIIAYDLDDTSYEQLPSYHIAGVGGNVSKRFIAEYPTDVQWNGNDPTQDEEYRDLQTYLQKIGEGAVNSPLQTADSNPAP